MQCERCGKKLSRKTARAVDGQVICSACLFPKLKKGMTAPIAPKGGLS